MANFKGGFAFNNEAAKVEVEQSPNGALISCINPVTGESMGGGNPNSVQVITGTLDNPFGDVNLTELENAINNSSASFIMELDLSILAISTPAPLASSPIQLVSPYIVASQFRIDDNGELTNAIYASWNSSNRELHSAWANYGGAINDMCDYASQIPTTLTIYWHPMPEAEGE